MGKADGGSGAMVSNVRTITIALYCVNVNIGFVSNGLRLGPLGDVKEAEKATFGGECVNVGEEGLQAFEILLAFGGEDSVAMFLPGVPPELRDARGVGGRVRDMDDTEAGFF